MRRRSGTLQVVEPQLTVEEYGFALRKDERELPKQFNEALKKLKADGTYDKLVKKWFEAGQVTSAIGDPADGARFLAGLAGWRDLLHGALVTIEVTAASIVLGCLIGLVVGIGRLDPKRRIIYGMCSAYVSFIRGTPLLVQLFIWFFGLPHFGLNFPAFFCGIVGMGMYSGAYVSEIVRGAIQSIERGQMEAARVARHDAAPVMRTSWCRRRWCA